jgi:hypothetical protein
MPELLWLGRSFALLAATPDDEAFGWKSALYILLAFGLVVLNGFFVLAEFAMVKGTVARRGFASAGGQEIDHSSG